MKKTQQKRDEVLKDFVLSIFVEEVIKQCEFALMSWEYLQACLMKTEYEKIRVFYHIQAFLVAVANISKLLCPIKEFKSRGEKLRRVLQVPKNSPILNRDFRNHFEHYDDRIEKWSRSSKKKNISYMNISVAGFSPIPSQESTDLMRNLDHSHDRKNFTLTFHDESHDLTKVMDAVRDLHKRAGKIRPNLFYQK